MSKKTDTSLAPYYDDYNENKKFLSILFRGKTVQTRELTQLQTILQNQIERFGNHVFKEGAIVIPGGFQISDQEVSLGISLAEGTNLDIVSKTEKVHLRSTTSNRRILVSFVDTVGDSSAPVYVFGTTTYPGNTNSFSVGEGCVFEYTDDNGVTSVIGSCTIQSSGQGSIASIERGVMYIRGYFVLIDKTTIAISRSTKIQNGKVGLKVSEDIITASQDATLYSNATGSYNEKAEGANRFAIYLELVAMDLDEVDSDFVELARVKGGFITTPVQTTQYSLLEDSLSKRTFEESGDYTVGEYSVEIKEHTAVYPQGDESKLVAVLSPGISYVRGHRIQNQTPQYIEFDKARETDIADNAVVGINYGSYIEVQNPKGIPEVGVVNRIEFFDSSVQKVADAALTAYRDGRVYVVDVVRVSGRTLSEATSVVQIVNSQTVFTADIDAAVIVGTDKRSMLFPLPVSGALTLSPSGSVNTLYRVSRTFQVTISGGTATVSTGSTALLFDPDVNSFLLGSRDVGSFTDYVDASYTRGGSPVGTSLTIDAAGAPDGVYYLLAKVINQGGLQRTKTKRTIIDTVVMTASDTAILSKSDGIAVDYILESGSEVTDEFIFDGGQRDNRYERASIKSKTGVHASRTLQVAYSYFQHSAGDFFSVDSYASLNRSEPITYTTESGVTIDLRDYVDFRPDVSNLSITNNFVFPDSTFVADVQFYLPRIDSLTVSFENGYRITKGVSDVAPKRPAISSNSMRLFDLVVPPYTGDATKVVIVRQSQNRYTMRDIARLEKRIENLEYYTTLSALESDALNIQAIDPITGQNRFKNGIFADPMTDFRLLDVSNSKASIDINSSNGRLLPSVIQNALDFTMVSGGVVEDDMVMPAYTEVLEVEQPYATGIINVNPYAVFSWEGFLNLSPSRDFWVETKYLEPIIQNETVNLRGSATPGVIYGNWTGSSRTQQVRDVTTTTFTEWSETDITDNLITTEVIPYMRSVDITFEATGLRPFTRVYPFFDGVDVSPFTYQVGKNFGDPIETTSSGSVRGVFTVPSAPDAKFLTGRSTFILVDNAEVATDDPDEYTTFTEAGFESSGRLETRQQTQVTTRYLGFTRRTTEEYRRYDPVAQSFAIDTRGGMFLSSVDIFFFSKSQDIPVTLEIRAMENGLPTHDVLARVVLEPNQVSTSDFCNIATNFKLRHPIYLEQGVEYCVVVLANTQDYQVGYSELGQTLLEGGFAVAKQPNMGVMFTSANGSTWTANQNRDLKFSLHRCKFDGSTHQITFKPKTGADFVRLGSNPISGVSGETVATINQPGHGVSVGQTVTVRNSLGGLGVLASQINTDLVVSEVVDHDNFKVDVGVTLTGTGVMYQPSSTRVELRSNYMVSRFYPNIETLDNDSVSLVFEYRYRSVNGMSGWLPLSQKNDNGVPVEGKFENVDDFEIRATMTTTDNIAPQIDLHGFTAVLNSFYVATDEAKYVYQTQPLFFTNPSTKAQFYVNVLLPGVASFKAFVKVLGEDQSDTWVEVPSTTPLVNDSVNFFEYKFEYDVLQEDRQFSGLLVKLEFYSDRVNVPIVRDFRGVVFA